MSNIIAHFWISPVEESEGKWSLGTRQPLFMYGASVYQSDGEAPAPDGASV